MNQTQPAPFDKRRENIRLALVLGSVALAFFVGFMLKVWWMQ
ncbi:MAG: cytochrome oxidase small assembly protein [Rhodocyclaceae bacterium]|nr:cytochrome oxidase small assembly protein [Rhodocyclaceae bacterium]